MQKFKRQRRNHSSVQGQKQERKKLEKIIKDRKEDKEAKKQARAKLKELNEEVEKKGRKNARADFNYPIFMCEAESVGISSTGETGESVANELPEILAKYREFKKDEQKFIENLKK